MILRRALGSALCLGEWSTAMSSFTRNSSVLATKHGSGCVTARPLSGFCHYRSNSKEEQKRETRNKGLTVQAVRCYARPIRKKQDYPSQLADLPPSLLKKEYAGIQCANQTDDLVKKLLTLELASHKEKLKIKTEQMIDMVRRNPNDNGSTEVQVATLTVNIRNLQEHLQKHPKDKSNKRRMLMAIDRRKKLLKYLRRTRYDLFENVCKQLGITYTFPQEYYRKATRRWAAKKALCIKVFNEVRKQRLAERLRQKEAEAVKQESAAKEESPV
ncbi:28S ribosomal protein S15, mitochondrial-like [Acipenser oxyrinchus oxyrinchus]|uniref:Small ribosomal subunit protein uS15m n=1 Tax=Acipenser oxyrinchus oxyrinchus TaxID=40147 RepID=A0AAD8CU68_ACIOX|nr:28S ribosomal protein S15, mitochondrial-like [Acipenser oxyrinchus oxyrinchus]